MNYVYGMSMQYLQVIKKYTANLQVFLNTKKKPINQIFELTGNLHMALMFYSITQQQDYRKQDPLNAHISIGLKYNLSTQSCRYHTSDNTFVRCPMFLKQPKPTQLSKILIYKALFSIKQKNPLLFKKIFDHRHQNIQQQCRMLKEQNHGSEKLNN